MKNRKKRKVFYHKLKQNSSVIRWTIKFMMAFLFLALIWQFHLEAEGVRAEEEGITNPSVTQITAEAPQMAALNTNNPSFTAPSLNDFLLQPQQDLFRNTPTFSTPQSIYPVNGNPIPVNTKNPDIIYVSPDYEIEGDLHRHHIFVQGIKIATIETNSRTKQEKIYYHHSDHLGGSSLTTDQFGSIVEETTYHPFGETRSQQFSKNYHNPYLYTGKEKDKGTDLYYYGARYYDPSIARFTSIDPWEGDLRNPQTLNKYSYVMNNPVKYTDPTGEVAQLVVGGGVLTLVAVMGTAYLDQTGILDNAVESLGYIVGQIQEKGSNIFSNPAKSQTEPNITTTPAQPQENTEPASTPAYQGENTNVTTTPAQPQPGVQDQTTAIPAYNGENAGSCGVNMSCSIPDNIGDTLDRIDRGESHPHKRDGAVFQNREGLLPSKPEGYYREYVHPTPGVDHAGSQRVITGESGERYYTPDHYGSFEKIK